ncbi:peptide-methionine (S)-S-oxide reductase [Paracoccus aerodenitrificans]|uniref:peptide-methionine (S)-S-oxide reductase n=1 Tax=Paracoccus aerodenitrificans TaxID=3017781 RepID=UPI0022EFF7D5|nr:peptide-methionine (S)-S-oxide reductase [Paracoccus aerodenitrificans]WBU64268.1 peptide-methionine (S)-S-oxide reductase [Paracoccus aerodenitrificans]
MININLWLRRNLAQSAVKVEVRLMIQSSGFGGGCHWCTEAVFQSLRGVMDVKQGFIASSPPHDSFSEAVAVTWDPALITFDDLIAVHLATHSSTSHHKMRGKYRSAIYVHDAVDGGAVRRIIDLIAQQTDSDIVTKVLSFEAFKPSDARFKNYYIRNRNGPFCEAYIEPKLALLRQRFASLQLEASTDA